MSISGLYELASAISAKVGGVSLLTAVFDRPDNSPNHSLINHDSCPTSITINK